MNRDLNQSKEQQSKKERFKKIVKDMEANPLCTVEGAYKLAVKFYKDLQKPQNFQG